MPYRNIVFEENQPFHIFSRAVDGREIFKDNSDCYRFIFQLNAANVGKPVSNLWRRDTIKAVQAILHGEKISEKFVTEEHSPFVHILDFSLVINHYHLYLLSNIENGIPLFEQKLNGGFVRYFNLKYNRKGSLFGSRYKSIAVETEFQSDAVSRYISIINPLDVYQPGWREKGLYDYEEAFRFLEEYQFSSFPDKIGKRQSKILAPRQIIEKYFPEASIKNKKEFIQFVKEFLEERSVSPNEIFAE